MRAAIATKYGSPDVIQVKDIPKPLPNDDEVLIRIKASTVNRTDYGFLSAEYFIGRFWSGLIRPKNQTLGCEFAGEVESVGKNVTEFQPEDRVFGYDDKQFGGHAEYKTIPASGAIAHLPSSLSFDTAAALTEGAHYALCDIRAAKITRGQRVCVNGGTGAIGSSAIQLLKYMGVEVTAVCHTDHLQLVKSLGADTVIDYTQEDFTLRNEQFDVVFDAVGKSTFGKCKRILTKRGIYISTELGPGSQNPFLAMITPITGGKKVLFPIPSITKYDVEYLKECADLGAFKPVIDRHYSLERIADAYRYVQTGMKTGNVIIRFD